MRLTIDTDTLTVCVEQDGNQRTVPLDSPEAFHLISQQWVTVGWTQRYTYGFSWLGRPVIQLPEDMVRIQEVIHRVQPEVIIETGVAHGGSLVYYASLCKSTDRGRVIGIDIEIRPHNRSAIEAHALARYITLVEGNSVAPEVISQVKDMIRPNDRVLVLLDSNHTKAHVLAELDAYSPLVSENSYIVAMDGIMAEVAGRPGSKPGWEWDNPSEAAREFAAKHSDFVLEDPGFLFNEGYIKQQITHWPSAYLRRTN
jgi:cephalosporin hydroxylase